MVLPLNVNSNTEKINDDLTIKNQSDNQIGDIDNWSSIDVAGVGKNTTQDAPPQLSRVFSKNGNTKETNISKR